jgi:hypothetical protein
MANEPQDQITFNSSGIETPSSHETNVVRRPLFRQRRNAMMIFMLAAAMTLAMLIATAFGLHQEAQRVRLRQRARNENPHRPR